ncbi:recombinase family protein [Mesorhizobium sp.]|uniref:recombinase family protein n=1 Tax=Mesorhizobium sp. TaxID=1871066 RepID=UPI000FE4ABC6|nr:recombinase family protein [Mesorhizobium sp.]RWQ14825.1 MAG: recombinase family protein [Mesorhizobium sp.]
MPKAYSYIRFSTPEQARGDSLRRQVEQAEKWAVDQKMQIDESLREFGVSAHRGAHVEHGSVLGKFLDHVQSGRVEKGSFLIVESMDRLSREAVMQALPRFIDILNAGVIVVTLSDGQVYSKESIDKNPYQIMVSLGPMIRSHEESQIKSVRVGEAWAKKRERARAGTHLLTRRTPEWITIKGGMFDFRDGREEIVRRVFRETIEGHGRRTIALRLNLEQVPTFRAGENRKKKPKGWQPSSIAKILNSRAVFGEFQPGTGTSKYGTHKPEGAPIKGYYPAAIDEDIFNGAQGIIASRRSERDENGVVIRRGKGGRRGYGIAHLLIGLGRCNRCHGPIHTINKGKGALYFECDTARRKAGCDNQTRWRVDEIERRLLKHLSYIDADAVLEGGAPSGEAQRVAGLHARLADVKRERDAVLRIVKTGDEAAVREFEQLAAQVKEAAAELAEAETALARAAADPGLKARLAEAVDLNRAMDEAEGDQRTAIRVRLAEQLRQLVEMVRFDPELSVIALLKARPDIAPEDIPFVYGAKGTVPWILVLDDESEPHGPEPWAGQDDESRVPIAVALPSLAQKIAASRGESGSR